MSRIRSAIFSLAAGAAAYTALGHEIGARETAGSGALLEAGLPLAIVAVWYVAGLRRLWRHSGPGQGIRASEALWFALGWAALTIALLSPMDTLGGELFWVHMLQHEVLMLIAAPLLVLGRPLPAFVWALPRAARSPAARAVQAGAPRSVWRVLTHPGTAWALHAAALWIWHAPAAFEAALTHRWIHDLQHVSFVLTALLFWFALLRAHPRQSHGAGALYLFTTMVHTTVLGALITFAASPWYPTYLHSAPEWGLTALEDQQLGGLIMWVPGSLVYLLAALALLARWIGASERPARSRAPETPAPGCSPGAAHAEGAGTDQPVAKVSR